MGNKGIWILLVIATVVGIIFWSAGGSRIKDEAPYYLKNVLRETAEVTIGETVIKAEVADTAQSRTKGLKGREYVAPGKGMLFVFGQAGEYSFTMQEVLITLDIIWILDDTIVAIERQAQPEALEINPAVEANYVLEVSAGTASSWQIGNQVAITFDKK